MKESLIEYLQMMLQDYEYNKDDDECMIGDCEFIKTILHIVSIIEATDEQLITKAEPTMSDVLEMYTMVIDTISNSELYDFAETNDQFMNN